MDLAMGKEKRVLNTRAGVLGALVLGTAFLTSGGCTNQKDEQIAALNSEIATLKEEQVQLEQARIAAETRAQEAAAKQAQQPAAGTPGGYDTYNNVPPQQDVVITVAGDVLFASGQVSLRNEAKAELDRVARDLNGRYASNRIRIEGYTDSDPIRKSKFPSNEALSQARAESVQQYLVSRGVSPGRISAVGMGSAKPKATKAASRRVEIVIMGS